MRILLYLIVFAIALSTTVSCSEKTDNSRAQAAESLYRQSVNLTLAYTDSMSAAKDSACVLRLSKELDDTLTHLNFNFPADTDIDMNEGQNDTLRRLNQRFVMTRDSMLYLFGHPVANDSTATDSVPKTESTLPTKGK